MVEGKGNPGRTDVQAAVGVVRCTMGLDMSSNKAYLFRQGFGVNALPCHCSAGTKFSQGLCIQIEKKGNYLSNLTCLAIVWIWVGEEPAPGAHFSVTFKHLYVYSD